MSVMSNFTLRSLAKNRVRTGVTVAGVALAAALLTAVLTSVTSLNAYLYNCEVADNGIWTASAWTESEDEIAHARADARTSDLVVMRDVGFVDPGEAARRYGAYLPFVSTEGDLARICAVKPAEGRAAEGPDEVMLPSSWKGTSAFGADAIKVGSTLEVELGQRELVAAGADAGDEPSALAGHDRTRSGETPIKGTGYEPDEAGERLDSGDGYRNPQSDGGGFGEKLVELNPRTFTVVGFYDTRNIASSTGVGYAALTTGWDANATGWDAGGAGEAGAAGSGTGGADADAASANPTAAGTAKVYVATAGLRTAGEIDEAMKSSFDSAGIAHHDALLRYEGITSDRAIWNTFFQIAAVLACVIAAACVSLIYNAFAISVAERTRQFGLLSSIGASRRQIRRAIAFEAAVITAAGIPLGLLAGIGGTAAVLGVLGPSLESIIGEREDVAFGVAVDPAMICLAAVLTLITVMVSAWLPARRAGNASAIDAIRRTRDVRPVRPARKRAGKTSSSAAATADVWKPRGFGIHRLFGVSGQIAWANRKRGRAKGRAASVSLALAIVLLMTAGSLSTTLDVMTGAAIASSETCDITVSTFRSYSPDAEAAGAGTRDGASNSDSAADGNLGADGEDAGEAADASAAGASSPFEAYAALYAKLSSVEGVQPLGWQAVATMPAVMPADMVGAGMAEDGGRFNSSSPVVRQPDGTYFGHVNLQFLENEAFAAYARSVGASPDAFSGDTMRGIALSTGYSNNGQAYVQREMIKAPGTISCITEATFEGVPVEGFVYSGGRAGADAKSPDGNADAREAAFSAYLPSDYAAADKEPEGKPLSALDLTYLPVEAIAVTDQAPDGRGSDYPTVVLPLSAADTLAEATRGTAGSLMTSVQMVARFNADEHVTAAADLEAAGREFFDLDPEGDGALASTHLYVGDNAAVQEGYGTLVVVVNVFSLLFTGILMLIAMGNVFNTVTNGLVLRRREFAVMRSVGMGSRAFRRMIACECAGYAVRGLVPGVIVAAIVSFLLFNALAKSVEGVAFALPWGHMALACALTLLIMAASVAYGLRRCRTDNVVEALRMDIA
ncbi:ABC transporter permease [Adlercreutzia sp. ZJ242]|uniref:ABC transporter permease n=1 Tax=Adlercreutzia sp. ZJ242 TaxID=2709409 RepID=UPI0013E9B7A1|nr:ABC transporter permease [Adlercreutzia sp. ZJ242]